MQATYCDLCGKRITVGDVTCKQMPTMYPDGAHWRNIDICPNCVTAVAEFCSSLNKGDDDDGEK